MRTRRKFTLKKCSISLSGTFAKREFTSELTHFLPCVDKSLAFSMNYVFGQNSLLRYFGYDYVSRQNFLWDISVIFFVEFETLRFSFYLCLNISVFADLHHGKHVVSSSPPGERRSHDHLDCEQALTSSRKNQVKFPQICLLEQISPFRPVVVMSELLDIMW